MLFIISLLIQFFTVWVVFFFGLSRNTGAITTIIVAVATAFISPWSLIFGIPLILISLVVMIEPLRMALITKPAYKTLANAMPTMSVTEREALDAGTSWWEKTCLWGHRTGPSLKAILTLLFRQKNNHFWIMK